MNHPMQAVEKKHHQALWAKINTIVQPDEDEHVLCLYTTDQDCGGACNERDYMITNGQTEHYANIGHCINFLLLVLVMKNFPLSAMADQINPKSLFCVKTNSNVYLKLI